MTPGCWYRISGDAPDLDLRPTPRGTRTLRDTDPQYQGADSLALLAECARRVRAAGWLVGNVDSTIVAQAPKMAPHTAAMVANLAADLEIDLGQVNIKAKSAERLGAIGRGEGIAAEAIALLE